MIAVTGEVDGDAFLSTPPVDIERVELLLDRRPELVMDGTRPSASDLTERLSAMWLADESVIYVGKATRLSSRVGQYYTTGLGARSPHAGGWPLKVLRNLDELWVHWATSPMPELAEQQALAAFTRGVSEESRLQLWDREHPYPYANLEGPGGRKRHGIRGAREPKRVVAQPESAEKAPSLPASVPALSQAQTADSPRVTLHEEIAAILEKHGNRWMTTSEIAAEVQDRQAYVKRDGTSDVTAFQIHGRTKNYPHLFDRDGSKVRLIPSR